MIVEGMRKSHKLEKRWLINFCNLQSFCLPGDMQAIPFMIKATKTTGFIITSTSRSELRSLFLCNFGFTWRLSTIFGRFYKINPKIESFSIQRGYKNIIKSKTYFKSSKGITY